LGPGVAIAATVLPSGARAADEAIQVYMDEIND
jgi:hypothetical protein